MSSVVRSFHNQTANTEQETKSSANENRINSLLRRAQICRDKVEKSNYVQSEGYESRKLKLNTWEKKMFDKVDQIYGSCLTDLQQSFDQLKSFRDLMLLILNDEHENQIDSKKLVALEHEICILRCLTYHLDTSKVKMDGKPRLISGISQSSQPNLNGRQEEENTNESHNDADKTKGFPCRILIHKDSLAKIQNLDIFEKSVQMTKQQVDEKTPERILTVYDSDYLQVIQIILSSLYPSSTHLCELKLLLHQSYAPFIVGKLGDHSKMLREKYSLHTLTIHPTCAPHSTERVLLIQSSSVEDILKCLREIFETIGKNLYQGDQMTFYDESNYDASLAHEYGGYSSPEASAAHLHDQKQSAKDRTDDDYEDEGVRRYSALDAWNGSVEADTENELSVVRLGDDCVKREFWINHGQFGALLGPHGIRIAQIRSQCRTVRIHTVAGSSINTCSVQVMGPRTDVARAVDLIMQSIKEHDRKFPFKHHRFSGRLR